MAFSVLICLAVAAVVCAWVAIAKMRRYRRNLLYVVEAAINNDFSYHFSEKATTAQERDFNRLLNRLVAHIENLRTDARRQDELLQSILNTIDTGIIVTDNCGRTILSNRPGQTLTDLIGTPGIEARTSEAIFHCQPITIHALTDVSRVRQTAEIESLEKLIRVLTHEIMNSLTPINSICESWTRHPDAADIPPRISAIASSTASLMAFVKNFRKYTFVPEPQPKVLYLKPFLEQQVLLAREYPGGAAVEMHLSVFPPDTMVYTDSNMLAQVILNILKNAVEASPTRIDIEAQVREDEAIEIAVANDGRPIPAEVAGQIFTPFFTTKPGGSGIGLALSRRIVARLGGTLSLTSEAPTRFTLIL